MVMSAEQKKAIRNITVFLVEHLMEMKKARCVLMQEQSIKLEMMLKLFKRRQSACGRLRNKMLWYAYSIPNGKMNMLQSNQQ